MACQRPAARTLWALFDTCGQAKGCSAPRVHTCVMLLSLRAEILIQRERQCLITSQGFASLGSQLARQHQGPVAGAEHVAFCEDVHSALSTSSRRPASEGKALLLSWPEASQAFLALCEFPGQNLPEIHETR